MLVGRVFHNKRIFSALFDKENQMVFEIYAPIKQVLSNVEEIDISSKQIPIEDVTILTPVNPSKIVCIGRNYVEHAKEFNNEVPEEPLLFFKPPSSLIAHKGKVLYPNQSKHVDFEGELALIIRKKIKKAQAKEVKENPQEYFGYTPFLDMTARDIQKNDRLWTRGKGFDTFGPVGPWIELNPLPDKIQLKTYLNDELKQYSNIELMVHPPNKLLDYISQVMTLEIGDIIATGTPAGVGPVKRSDKVKLEIEGLPPLEIEIEIERS